MLSAKTGRINSRYEFGSEWKNIAFGAVPL
jgi:hypothetical protein